MAARSAILRSCPQGELRPRVEEYAATLDQDLLDELRRMARGHHGATNLMRWYGPQEQLLALDGFAIAARAPGVTQALKCQALRLLESVYASQAKPSDNSADIAGQGTDPPWRCEAEAYRFSFPNAMAGLADALAYTITLSDPGANGPAPRDAAAIDAQLEEVFARPAHRVVRDAIVALELSIPSRAQIRTAATIGGERQEWIGSLLRGGERPYTIGAQIFSPPGFVAYSPLGERKTLKGSGERVQRR